MKDLGEAKNCLGMRITRNQKEGKIWIDQIEYIKNILEKFNMGECRPVSTPMETGISFNNDDKCLETVPYQEAIGCLLYLSQISRPDICYSVNSLSKYNKCPNSSHWKAVKRVFRYLKGTLNYKLEYDKKKNDKMIFYSDADWANSSDRHSISGSCTILHGGAINWFSKKQRTIALSTTEAEYMALSFTAQEALWIRQLVKEIYGEVNNPMEIRCDNLGSTSLSRNKIVSPKSKHIDVRHHFIRELAEERIINVDYLPTQEMVADIFTKPLEKGKFEKFADYLGLKMG